jgi:glucosyl-dolichyl phosphate glucuronosyltransferase
LSRLLQENKFESHLAFSVIICTYDRHKTLELVIASLSLERRHYSGFEILVVDNSPDQKAGKAAAKKFSNLENFRYLFEPRPGLSNARNVGWKAARSEIIAYLDDDAVVHPGWAKSLVEGFRNARTQVGMAGGKVQIGWPHERPIWLHKRITPYLGYCNFGDEIKTLSKQENIVGCNMAFRKQALVAAGGFDVNLGRNGDGQSLLSNEETRLSILVQKAGFERIYLPGMLVTHLVAAERLEKDWFRRRFDWQAVSDVAAGNSDLHFRIVRAKFRRLVVPGLIWVFRLLRNSLGAQAEQWCFYLELETLYDKTLLSIQRQK